MRTRAKAIHRPGVMNKTEAAYGFHLSNLLSYQHQKMAVGIRTERRG